ncbi:MAG: inorganic phosphate transporter [Candidatus Verstraetearchaeota archaeon]|nr:inorganic phosphate transporter [Candidatus Verstraetearchaeota archaeon]
MDTILLFLGLLLSFIMAINIGGNDAANPTSTAIGSGALSLRRALMLFAIFVLLGALLQGYMVMKTIGKGIVPEVDILGAFIIVLSANIWIFFATMRGMAISTTHSIVAAVIRIWNSTIFFRNKFRSINNYFYKLDNITFT